MQSGGDRSDIKQKIIEHYDELSPYYHDLWGQHIHHGYWKTNTETKEQAQIQLIDELATRAEIKKGSTILDVGCGVGGTSIYLANKYSAQVTGITISKIQVEMAIKLSSTAKISPVPKFLHLDAELMSSHFDKGTFDYVWISEVLSHFKDKKGFFGNAARVLKPCGRLVLADWVKADGLNADQEKNILNQLKKECCCHNYLLRKNIWKE